VASLGEEGASVWIDLEACEPEELEEWLRRLGVEDLARSQSWLSSRSVAGLASAIVLDLSLSCLHRTADLRAVIISLEDRMDRDPDEVEAEEICRMRSDLVTLGALVSDQLTAVQAMSATARSFFQVEDAREYVSCALVNLQSADRSLDWLDNRIGTLRSGFEMHAQDQTNRRLNILTILSAIFNPATLLAGVWGMNFAAMPELGWHFGYPMALGLMFAIGWLMFQLFRSGGWFD